MLLCVSNVSMLFSRTLPDIPIQHNTDGSLRDFINWKFKYADQNFYLYYQKVLNPIRNPLGTPLQYVVLKLITMCNHICIVLAFSVLPKS